MKALGQALFEDRARPWVALAVLIVLSVLGHQTAQYTVREEGGARRCFEDPTVCANEEVVLSVWHVVDSQSEEYRVSRLGHVLRIQGSPEGLEPGGRVSVRGRFDSAGARLIEQERVSHPLWKVKRNFSILGALGVFCWLLARIRVVAGGLVCRA